MGFVGLPPEGATQSTPEIGELVLYLSGRLRVNRTWVHADGWVIRHRAADLLERANPGFYCFLPARSASHSADSKGPLAPAR
jgi:hypothetical protein